ncbi:MAG TPA: FtsW/RodA/SpoVE family cell cycle protein [Clostridiaceae bacterium]|nr:FtsW/RodA/SpoVE family cell cycle protein [Clostridiaceae bacterium]
MRSIQRNENNQYDLTLSKPNEKPEEKEADFLSELGKFRRLNAPLLIVTIVLVCFGLIMLFSASMSTSFATQADDSKYYFIRQAGMIALGLGAGLFIANFFEIKSLNKKWLVLGAYVFTTILLILVIVKGRNEMGATRWLNIGPIGLQPSEVAKFSSVLFLAYYFSFTKGARARGKFQAKSPSQQFWLDGRIDFLFPVLILGFWLILIVIQPHLSGAIIFLVLCFAVFLAARIPWKSWLSGIIQLLPILLIITVLVSLILPVTKGMTLSEFIENKFAHSAKRIETFEATDEVSEDQSYQIRQAEIAMGTGGLTGVGLGQGRQKYNYLPQVHNDYIFPAIAEELGYLGTMSVLILFAIQFFIGVKIALNANSVFACLIAWGYSFLIILQVLLNVAVATEVIPATGITLPFFSYGGTSNIVFLVEIGMVLCVSRTGQTANKVLSQNLAPASENSR